MRTNVVVVGGGAIGAAVAYFIRRRSTGCDVAVVEPDPSYRLASTPRASGGVRRLFSLLENIQLSNFSIPFLEKFAAEMEVDGQPTEIGFKKNGYLFIVPPMGRDVLRRNFHIQASNGVNVIWREPDELAEIYPSMRVDDLGGAVQSPDDGWVDPYAVLRGFRLKSQALGARYVADRVSGFVTSGGSVTKVLLGSGETIATDYVVNAAGAWADEICAMVGLQTPIRPMRRYEHYFECDREIEPLPYVKDLSRLAFRPEGSGYSGGLPNSHEPRGVNFEVDHSYFEGVVWPALAHRFPAFETVKERNVIPGLYDQNDFDGNPIIGPWTNGLENFILAAGFSGHGLMHAPGCGLAVAELILLGRYETIDLARFGWARIAENRPLPEAGIL